MKIGYFADGQWAHRAIELMIESNDIEIVFIVPRFDTQDPVLKAYAKQLNIPFLLMEDVNSESSLSELAKYSCDIFVSMSFNQIIRRELINLSPKGFINCHAGALPFYRGRNPLNWVLINDEKEFGITVHYIDEGIDTGDIIERDLYPITDNDDYSTLLSRAIDQCGRLLLKALLSIKQGKANRVPQSMINSVGSYFFQRKEGDEFIDFNWSSRRVFNFVRALSRPGPLARFRYKGNVYLVESASILIDAPAFEGNEGQVIDISDSNIVVKVSDKVIKLLLSVDQPLLSKEAPRLIRGQFLNDHDKKAQK
tara:strand:+ start:55 stop:984 length:930 start_codon:yes stop_codon:yes gene_type:complete